MKRSTERFLTTHTGSLPRPDDLVRVIYAKEEGVPVERQALAAQIRTDPELRAFFFKLMGEAIAVGKAAGVAFPPDYPAELEQTVEAFPPTMKASMAHDLERGNRLELDWLAGKVVALGRALGVPTPANEAIYATLKLHRMGHQ